MRFNGVVFPHQLRKLCQYMQAVAKNTQGMERAKVQMETVARTEAFSHKSVLKQVLLAANEEDTSFNQYRIIVE